MSLNLVKQATATLSGRRHSSSALHPLALRHRASPSRSHARGVCTPHGTAPPHSRRVNFWTDRRMIWWIGGKHSIRSACFTCSYPSIMPASTTSPLHMLRSWSLTFLALCALACVSSALAQSSSSATSTGSSSVTSSPTSGSSSSTTSSVTLVPVSFSFSR